jgi:preprotein translocase subunit SecE
MIKKINNFVNDVKVEMAKVSWPARDELINSTIIVTVVSILFTIFIFLSDSILSKIMKFFINL